MTIPPIASTEIFTVTALSPELAAMLCTWRYDPPFDFYNWSSWEVMLQLGIEFGDEYIRDKQYAAVLDQKGTFVGFAQFFPLLDVTRIGLGLRPDLCGNGLGLPMVKAIVSEALRRSPSDEIDLEVHVWNLRAIRTYEQADFIITDTYPKRTADGLVDVHCMTYTPQPPAEQLNESFNP
ncbi:N-acetyltransferase [Paenibacillus baekrokdamisoli]|uniref:N-acetyltransferase n=1 Tax=Paenibacillus baekrokdamisoli TaxID=1712516 RepID=A0A3G9IWK3_9BACL|nr:GNAT family protein [Paenibacillus baekrokdamisoli]MBB3073281.1 RimJ/RimL family protein N-acetyltransferase [Paenibacillus baekrokdamisoli]BBH23287.1 N-acetyltransferase [Paenibacillus baekrokdamisoli]